MNEWQHFCYSAQRKLLIPANEVCDHCGLAPDAEHYFDWLDRWLGFGEHRKEDTNEPGSAS